MKYLLTTLLLLCVFLAKAQNKTFIKVTADTVNTVTATISDTIHSDYSKTDTLEVTEYATIDSAFIRDLVIEIISGDTASFDSLYSRVIYVLIAHIDTIISDTIYVLHTYVLNITADTLEVTEYAVIDSLQARIINIDSIYMINGTQVVYLPDQTDFVGSIIFGNGGRNLSHSAGTEGYYNTFTGIGAGILNTTGGLNTAFGYQSLGRNTEGFWNTAIGYSSMYLNTTGHENCAIGVNALTQNTTGSWNIAIGPNALGFNESGNGNIAIGDAAFENDTMSNNLGIGVSAGQFNESGSQNIFIGNDAGYLGTTGSSNIFIGFQAGYYETGSNKFYIENSLADSSEALLYGEFDNNFLRINDYLSIDTTKGANLFVNGTSEFTGDMIANKITNDTSIVSVIGESGSNLKIDSDTTEMNVLNSGQITMTDDTIYSGSGYVSIEGDCAVNQNVRTTDNVIHNQIEIDTIIQNGMIIFRECVVLADDDSLFLPDATTMTGKMWIDDSDRTYGANIHINTNGVTYVYNETESTNCDNANTDGKLCLIDRGTIAVIKNRTGAEKTICYEIKYKQ